MTESNTPPADLKGAQDRMIAELRSMTFIPNPFPARRSIPSRGPRKAQKKPIR